MEEVGLREIWPLSHTRVMVYLTDRSVQILLNKPPHNFNPLKNENGRSPGKEPTSLLFSLTPKNLSTWPGTWVSGASVCIAKCLLRHSQSNIHCCWVRRLPGVPLVKEKNYANSNNQGLDHLGKLFSATRKYGADHLPCVTDEGKRNVNIGISCHQALSLLKQLKTLPETPKN